MWIFTYIALLFSGQIGGEILFVLAVLCLPVSAMIAARNGATIMEGMQIGLCSAILNLLLIGSIVGGNAPSDMLVAGIFWVGGLFVASALLGFLGAAVGHRMKPCSKTIDWQCAFCVAAASLVFLMLVTGGLVTSMEAGLAVPDWPNSYGHNMLLYPLSEMVSSTNQGVFFEHAHRLTGMFVGLTSLMMVVLVWKWQTSTTLKVFAICVFVLVCVQGVLGGLRVTDQNLLFAIIHGVVGQLIFTGFVMIAALMSPSWKIKCNVCSKGDRRLASMLAHTMVFQLILGATYRHMISDVDLASKATHVLYTHIAIAIIIIVFAVLVGLRLASKGHSILRLCGISVMALVGLQLLLGGGALIVVLLHQGSTIPMYEVLVTTAHQANGALLLGASFLCLAWTRRLICV